MGAIVAYALNSQAMTELLSSNSSSWAATVGFAIALCASLLLKFWLAGRQIRHVAQHRAAVPDAFAARISLAAHQKAADYTIAKARFGLIELAWGTSMVVVWTLLGGLHFLNQWLLDWLGSGLNQQVALLLSFVLIGSVLDVPFSCGCKTWQSRCSYLQ